MPDDAGVIVRTAAEGASEEELRADVERLTAQWDEIKAKAESAAQEGRQRRRPGAAARRARPDRPRRPRHLQRGLHHARRLRRRGLGRRSASTSTTSRPTWRRACSSWTARGGRLRRAPHRRAARQGAGPQGLAALGRLAGHRPHRGDDRRRRQHRQVHRLRAATSRRPSPRTTSRPPRRSSASSGCATSAASSSSTSSTWCWSPTATSCCAACSSASAATAPSTRSPRSPRSAWSR